MSLFFISKKRILSYVETLGEMAIKCYVYSSIVDNEVLRNSESTEKVEKLIGLNPGHTENIMFNLSFASVMLLTDRDTTATDYTLTKIIAENLEGMSLRAYDESNDAHEYIKQIAHLSKLWSRSANELGDWDIEDMVDFLNSKSSIKSISAILLENFFIPLPEEVEKDKRISYIDYDYIKKCIKKWDEKGWVK